MSEIVSDWQQARDWMILFGLFFVLLALWIQVGRSL